MSKTVHDLIDYALENDGLVPAMIIFGDKNNDSRMMLSGQVIREDFARLLASASVFAEIGRPGTDDEVNEIIEFIVDLLEKSKESL